MQENMKYRFLQAWRILISWLIIFFLFNCFDLGHKQVPFYLGVTLGIVSAGVLRKKSFFKILFVNLLAYFCSLLVFAFLNNVFLAPESSAASADFLIYRAQDAFDLFCITYVLGLFFTWLFWRFDEMLSFEAFGFSAFLLWILSSHRNFQLDAPKKLNELAWHYAIDPLNAFLGIAAFYIVLVCLYLFFASNRALVNKSSVPVERGKYKAITFLTPLFLISFLLIYAVAIAKYLAPEGAGSAMSSEGVGMKSQEGQSPLRFNSAVNKVKQPMAVVRLESDYGTNPMQPMLYFREQALSEYDGKEMVLSKVYYDVDVPQTKGNSFKGKVKNTLGRVEVKHSVYLLADHPAPFAIDFPKNIVPIKNPDEERFKTSYLANSLALQIPLAQLIGEEVGEKDWDEKTWQHYTRAPGSLTKDDGAITYETTKEALLDEHGEDLRYRLFAKKLTEEALTPVEKAQSIMKYLSDKSLYTLSPGHQVSERGDPVAPYLFSKDMRGYCVHFAHAIVYMLRLLDIPARIGTGYLTDLTYAKDGHILLQSSDRHAWPEMYVRGIGWVVVDITPKNVEGEQDLVPDAKLLEELMNKLGPIEELASSEEFNSSFKDLEESGSALNLLIRAETLYTMLLSSALLFIALKLWMRFSYLLALSERTLLKRKYLSFASLMTDLGHARDEGETRLEYARRLESQKLADCYKLVTLYELFAYSKSKELEKDKITLAFKESIKSYKTKWARLKRFLAFFNPASIFRWTR